MEGWERRAKQREGKLRKRRSADMVVSNRSIKTVIIRVIARKGRDAAITRRP